MFEIAALIGIYSYSIFTIGLLDLLKPQILFLVTIFFILTSFIILNKKFKKIKLGTSFNSLSKLEKLIIIILLFSVLLNLIGVFVPELAFDSLWYHLTLPRIYLAAGKIFYIPGALFYYSAMPKIVEMLYIPALSLGNQIIAKFIEYFFGLGSLIVTYLLAKEFVNKKLSLIASLAFYTNIVVMWLSTTAYIDLGWTFLESLALLFFIRFLKGREVLWKSSITLGLAIVSKLLSLFSLPSYILILFLHTKSLNKIIKFLFVTLLIPLPWMIFAYIYTRNPIYPFFEPIYKVPATINLSNLLNIVHSQDPISPIYLIMLPIILITLKRFKILEKYLFIYCSIAFIFWFVFQSAGGGRYFVAYLPALSVLCVVAFSKLKNVFIVKYLIGFILLISVINLGYRFLASVKYFPVVFGYETQKHFLINNLKFSYGDFYDVDEYFKKNINKNDKVLTIGIHNLYYADFPFIDITYLSSADKFNYILVRGKLPQKYDGSKLIYKNELTSVKLYKLK